MASGIEFNGPENDSDPSKFRPLLRKAAADATVLLKNDDKILPLSIDQPSSPKKIAVIGPNAKRAYTSGGGSAVLLSTYTVSPLKGIEDAAVAFGADVQYRIGVTSASFNYLPLMDDLIEFDDLTDHLKKLDLPDEIKGIVNDLMEFDGKPGALIEFWNESPLDDFMKTKADLEAERPVPVWLTHTRSTNCFLADGIVSLANKAYRRLLNFSWVLGWESQWRMLASGKCSFRLLRYFIKFAFSIQRNSYPTKPATGNSASQL